MARLSAAIDIITTANESKRPAILELSSWQRANRYAGSKDRAAIYNLLQDCYRFKGEITAIAQIDSPRVIVFGTAIRHGELTLETLQKGFETEKYAPQALSAEEQAGLERVDNPDIKPENPWDEANVPEWIWEKLVANFDEDALVEAQGLCARPPVDIRVNTLKASIEKIVDVFDGEAIKSELSPLGLRFAAPKGAKNPAQPVNSPQFKRGEIEIQDEGSQIVSQLIYAQPGEKILDYCAGGGGKSLAMAATMKNKGQIFAYDAFEKRLSESVERIKRCGAHNIQLRRPKEGALDDLIEKMDRVIVDAPCTGSGTWRRRPDLKWRMTENTLQDRQKEQADILENAKDFPRIGGYLIYITCSLFMEENEEQIAFFLDSNPNYELISCQEVWEEFYGHSDLKPWSSDGYTITLTPASTQTDGFFFAIMERMG